MTEKAMEMHGNYFIYRQAATRTCSSRMNAAYQHATFEVPSVENVKTVIEDTMRAVWSRENEHLTKVFLTP